MTLSITIHLLGAVPALVIGAVMLFREKGTPSHKALGRVWVALILLVSISSFFVFEIRDGAGPSPIHLLSIWTLIAVSLALYHNALPRTARHVCSHAPATTSAKHFPTSSMARCLMR